MPKIIIHTDQRVAPIDLIRTLIWVWCPWIGWGKKPYTNRTVTQWGKNKQHTITPRWNCRHFFFLIRARIPRYPYGIRRVNLDPVLGEGLCDMWHVTRELLWVLLLFLYLYRNVFNCVRWNYSSPCPPWLPWSKVIRFPLWKAALSQPL